MLWSQVTVGTLLQDYLIFITQLETQNRTAKLTLHKLWFYLQPTLRTLELLYNTQQSITKDDAFGGASVYILMLQANC